MRLVAGWWRTFRRANPIARVLLGCLPLFSFCTLCSLLMAGGQAVGFIDPVPTTTPATAAGAVSEADPTTAPTNTAAQSPTEATIAHPTATTATSATALRSPRTPPPSTIMPSPTAAPLPADVYPSQPAGLVQARVIEVIDGDTMDVLVDGREERLRLIGLDTPETKDPRKPVQCFGNEASAKAVELLQGQTVALEQDPSQDTRDRYGRMLAFVWMPNGKLYNLEMIRMGYAHEYTYAVPYKYQAAFQRAEDQAQELGWGFWAATTCNGNTEQAADAPAAPAAPAAPRPTQAPAAPAAPATGNCDTSYPDVCVPPAPPDLDCSDIIPRRFRVIPPDPHRFDGNRDGVGCEG